MRLYRMREERFTIVDALKEPMPIVALVAAAVVLPISIWLYAHHMA